MTIARAAETKLFDFVAHLDYMRRVTGCNDNSFMAEKEYLLQTLAKNNIPTEVSTKGIRKNGNCYPAPVLLNRMQELNIPVLISDDAHHVSELTQDFSVAESLLQKMDYKNRWKL